MRDVWVARKPPGFAFVVMEDSRDARDAARSLNGTRICGNRCKQYNSTEIFAATDNIIALVVFERVRSEGPLHVTLSVRNNVHGYRSSESSFISMNPYVRLFVGRWSVSHFFTKWTVKSHFLQCFHRSICYFLIYIVCFEGVGLR